MTSMSDIPAHRVDQKTASKTHWWVGHYITAVGFHFLEAGLPAVSLGVTWPYTEEVVEGEPEKFEEIGASVTFTRAFEHSLGWPPGNWTTLSWDAQSGWYLDPQTDEGDLADCRWMGDGLVPDAGRVAAFVMTAQLEPGGAGSSARPFYRQERDTYDTLLAQLAPYVTGERRPPNPAKRPWKRVFSSRVGDWYSNRAKDALRAGENDPVVDVPLRRSEVRALTDLLALAETHGASFLVSALSDDLNARLAGGPGSADHRTALQLLKREGSAGPA